MASISCSSIKREEMGALFHHAHGSHGLEENRGETEFICNGCNRKGDSLRYECVGCGFYLHYRCAKAPKILKRCSKHDIDNHPMELNYVNVDSRASSSSSSPPLFLACEFCRAPITSGLFYRCNVCFVTLHMPCASKGFNFERPQKPQAQNKTTGRKRKIAARIATGLLAGVSVVLVKGAIAMATGGMISTFDGSEFSNFVPDLSDLSGGRDKCEVCGAPQESGADGCDHDGAGDDDEFDFGCDEEEADEDNLEDWEYVWE